MADNNQRIDCFYKTFPFDKVVLQDGISNLTKSKFGDLHVQTKIKKDDGTLVDYTIKFIDPNDVCVFNMPSISYYIAPGGDANKPSFYMNPILHPGWREVDKNGNQLKIHDEFGDSIQEFFEQYELTITNLLNALPKDIKNFLLGIKKGSQTTDFFTPIIGFPLYDDKQGLQAGQPNENQSPTFKVKAFMGDTTDQTKEYNKKNTEKLVIPNTKNILFTAFFDIRKSSKTGKNQIKKYEYIKPFLYSPAGHENASYERKELQVSLSILAPTLHIKHSTQSGVNADIQLTAESVTISGCSTINRNKELTDDFVNLLKRKTIERNAKYGIIDDDDIEDLAEKQRWEDANEENRKRQRLNNDENDNQQDEK
jgi:hypothetical protein